MHKKQRTIKKIIRLGTTQITPKYRVSVFCKIKFDGKRLSITGVEGPYQSGNCGGSAGQIEMHRPPIEVLGTGWTRAKVQKFWEIWNRWHLNNMRAECEHQRHRGETYETHPSAICPDCGYSLGSAWLTEKVPDHVLDFLESLPDTDKQPAWV